MTISHRTIGYYDDPQVTIDRILTLERAIAEGMQRIQGWLKK